jgi:hypothetical protein
MSLGGVPGRAWRAAKSYASEARAALSAEGRPRKVIGKADGNAVSAAPASSGHCHTDSQLPFQRL